MKFHTKFKIYLSIIFLFLISIGYSQTGGEDYNNTIKQADEYFSKGDYINAKAYYQIAIKLKPEEAYPRQRMEATMAQIKIKMDNSVKYTDKIMLADELYNKKDYDGALKIYQQALEFLPDDQYARDKVEQIEKMQREAKEKEENFNKNLLEGEKYFQSEEYENALKSFKSAQSIKPGDTLVASRIKTINELLTKEQNLEGDYEKALAAAEQFAGRQKYDEAIRQLEQAIKLKPGEEGPKNRLAEVRKLKAEYDSYQAIISDADNLYIDKQFEAAKKKYQEAIALRPDDEYPKNMLEKIDVAQLDLAHSNSSSYEIAIAQADKYYSEKRYDEAMQEYKNALRFKPDESYAKQKIADINKVVNLRESQEIAYNQSVARADKLFNDKQYEEAIKEYKNASTFKPLEAYPGVKINEINDILANLADKREQYDKVIKGADKLFFTDDYENARAQYVTARDMFPEEKYPVDQITMIDEILGRRTTYTKALTHADAFLAHQEYDSALLAYRHAAEINPDEAYPQQKIKEIQTLQAEAKRNTEIKNQYDGIIAGADKLFNAGNYTEAATQYQSASKLMPSQAYPQQKIQEIDSISNALAVREKLNKDYQEAIAAADKLLESKSYQEALDKYQAATTLKPGETYPKTKIEEINFILGEQAAKEKLEKDYQSAVAKGDNAFGRAAYDSALMAYQTAASLKPQEKYPQEKIAEARKLQSELNAKEALQKQYDDLIASADKKSAEGLYQEAVADYQKASGLMPGEDYPKSKIREINALVAKTAADKLDKDYSDAIAKAEQLMTAGELANSLAAFQAASALKPAEQYPIDKISEITKLQEQQQAAAELEKNYSSAISKADSLFSIKDYEKALGAYQQALTYKPAEIYPQEKIKNINNTLAELAKEAEQQKNYDEAIAFADKHLAEGNLDDAIYEYKKANSIKPDETYPLQKISEIEKQQAQIAKQKELERNYNKAIALGDSSLNAEKYEDARQAYTDALAIKQGEAYPTGKIAEIDDILKNLEAEREKSYQLSITKADNAFDAQDYELAKLSYERATSLKPDEVYPLDRLKEVNELILKQRQLIQEEYDKAIADADKFWAAKIYDNAIDSYRQAAQLKSSEEYPKEMVRRILKLISERAIVEINKNPLLISNNTTKKFDFIPVPVKDRKSNYLFFKARNVSSDNFKLIISFGKDQVKNGGIVVKIPPGEDVNDFIVRISAQYKWFSDDNNWITMYPEGGDIEVSQVQISSSD